MMISVSIILILTEVQICILNAYVYFIYCLKSSYRVTFIMRRCHIHDGISKVHGDINVLYAILMLDLKCCLVYLCQIHLIH